MPEHTFADVKRGTRTQAHVMALYRRWWGRHRDRDHHSPGVGRGGDGSALREAC